MKTVKCILFAGLFGMMATTGFVPPKPVFAVDMLLATDDTPGPPYITGGGETLHTKRPGIEIEIYRRLGKILNLNITFTRVPWKRCLIQLETGGYDGIFPASFRPERMKLGVYPMKDGREDPERKTRDTAYYLYKRKNSPLSWDGRSFHNLTDVIVAPLGWAVVGKLREMGVNVVEVPIPKNLPRMLIQGGVEGVACLDTVMDTYLEKDPELNRQIVKVHPPIMEKPYYLMLSHPFVKRHPKLAQRIWDTIRDIRASEEYRLIVEKYTN